MIQRARQRGFCAALNAPYPGGHILAAMGAPLRGVHAVQVEFDRALYLDADGRADADRALALGDWLRDAVLTILPEIGAADAWPLAAE
jgi:N-formylglutamate amidohydrolase